MTLRSTTNRSKSGFYIEVGCPGCGGRLTIESSFFVLTCEHCGSVLRLTTPDTPVVYVVRAKVTRREVRFGIDRYLKSNKLPLTGSDLEFKHIYYPYWKIDAVLLKVRNDIIRVTYRQGEDGQRETSNERRRTDINLTPYLTTVGAGGQFEGIPDTIGMRVDYLNVLPYSRTNTQDGFDAMPVARPWSEVWAEVVARVADIGEVAIADFGMNRTELFNPVASLVYFPYVIVESYAGGDFNRWVVDGVTCRVLAHVDEVSPLDYGEEEAAADLEFGELDVDFHRCPNCAEDLPAEQSYVYICRNCHQMIVHELFARDISQIALVSARHGQDDLLFPFWSLKMSAADSEKFQHLFGGMYRSDRLVIPAFKVGNFEAMYRLSKRLSAALPQFDLRPIDTFDRRCLPVGLSMSEALMLVDVVICRAELDRNPEGLTQHLKATTEEVSLFFAPFHKENYFYVDSALGSVTFEKSFVS